ncbi:hypothetical protein WA026_012230 [Henosepilachna vigintioctopunctata]|uniref:RING-CH-type domain-containing protein n=1 Tax=Henosepilachna vigintioctopunctata TaxID=420089 RepID=A0AAW1V6Y7_9CUCU
MARLPSSSGAKNKKRRDVIVSLFLTESTASLFNSKIPHLEDLHPSESRICIISSSETNYDKKRNNSLDDRSLISEIAYFQYGSFSSISIQETPSVDSARILPLRMRRNSIPYILRPMKVRTRPLVAVRSLAHDDRLNIQLNKIYVSLLDSDISLDSAFICRICHGGDSVDDLLKPCRCRGTVALVHLKCLERWLFESSRSYCELCQHHYEIIRQPRYNIMVSLAIFAMTPGIHMWELLIDFASFVAYTPIAVASTYTLMLLCDSVAKYEGKEFFLPHLIGFFAVLGIAAIDFTYTSWFMMTVQKHFEAWQEFRRNQCDMKIVLPKLKRKPYKRPFLHHTTESIELD